MRKTAKILASVITLILGFSNLASADNKTSIVYDISSLVTAQSYVMLVGGQKVTFNRAVAKTSQVTFEDLAPHSNWAHDAKIRVLDSGKNIVEEIAVRLPPVRFAREARRISGARLDAPLSAGPAFAVSDLGGKLKVADPSKYYAVLINGNGDQRHWNDMAFQFLVLTKVYGYSKDHIFVADSNFITNEADLDGDGVADIKYQSTVQGITDLLNLVKATVHPTDQLVIFTNDHGEVVNGESTLYLEDGTMSATDFAKIVNSIQVQQLLSIHEPCFSGGFVRPTVGPKRVTMAAAKNTESSYATSDGIFDEFIYRVTAAFAQQYFDGSKVSADTNSDGKISASEAFSFAITNDQQSESPLLEASDNSGDAKVIGLGPISE